MKHYCLTTIATVLILLSLTDSVFPDDIKTIDGNIITGEIVGVDGRIPIRQTRTKQHCIYSMANSQFHFKE